MEGNSAVKKQHERLFSIYNVSKNKIVHAVEEILHKIKDNFLRIKVIRGYIDIFYRLISKLVSCNAQPPGHFTLDVVLRLVIWLKLTRAHAHTH